MVGWTFLPLFVRDPPAIRRPHAPACLSSFSSDQYTTEPNIFSYPLYKGNTLTLNETAMVIEYGMTVGGHSLREYKETENHARAYEYVVSLVAGSQEPITQETILTLHQQVMSGILDEAQTGTWRTVPVYIRGSNITPPPARHVPRLMREWEQWVNGNQGQQYDPEVLSWAARYGRLEARKQGRNWYATRAAVTVYQRHAHEYRRQHGRAHDEDEA